MGLIKAPPRYLCEDLTAERCFEYASVQDPDVVSFDPTTQTWAPRYWCEEHRPDSVKAVDQPVLESLWNNESDKVFDQEAKMPESTPGPWGSDGAVVRDRFSREIAFTNGDRQIDFSEAVANARLIAELPVLAASHAALLEVAKALDQWAYKVIEDEKSRVPMEEHEALLAAIEQAENVTP